MTSTSFVMLNGRLYDAQDPCLSPQERGFLYGDGLFETIRVRDDTLPFLHHHYARLVRGCHRLHFPSPPALQALKEMMHAVLRANHLHNGSVRLTLSRGPGPRGLTPPLHPQPSCLISASPAAQQPPSPLTLHISRDHRRDERSILSRVKSLNTLSSILARLEAQDAGADDALMLNYRQTIAEASSATFIAYFDDTLWTPPLNDGALPGTSRARLLQAGHCRERTLPPQIIDTLEGAWLITALAVTPIRAINQQLIPLLPQHTENIRHLLNVLP